MERLTIVWKKSRRTWLWYILLVPVFIKGLNSIEHGAPLRYLTDVIAYERLVGVNFLCNISTFLVSIIAIVALLYSQVTLIRFLGTMYVFICFFFDSTIEQIMGRGLQFGPLGVLLFEQGAFAENQDLAITLLQFIPPATVALKRVTLLFVVFFLMYFLSTFRFKPVFLLFFPIAILAGYGAQARSGGEFVMVPSPIKVPALALLALQTPSIDGERQSVTMSSDSGRALSNILFIEDESVRGDFLQVNGFPYETTPYLSSIRHSFLNLGVASSPSNCSWSSDLLYRVGLSPSALPDKKYRSFTDPSIFQYAKRAGYETYFFDSQASNGRHHMIGEFEAQYIDHYVQIKEDISWEESFKKDRKLLRELVDVFPDPGKKQFIIWKKIGAHHPYEFTSPPATALAGYQEYIKKRPYLRLLRWAVDDFFKELFDSGDFSDSVVLYASDHGQSFAENPRGNAHCDWQEVNSSQASIPIMVFGQKGLVHFGDTSELVNNASGFQVFSSLLVWMGYDEQTVIARYPQPLWYRGDEYQKFVSGHLAGRYGYTLKQFDVSEFADIEGQCFNSLWLENTC